MSSKVDSLPFPLGTTLYQNMPTGTLAADIASGKLKGEEILGRMYEIEDRDLSSTDTVKPIRTYFRRWIMPVRNMSGSTLHRKRLFAKQLSTTNQMGHVLGYGSAAGQQQCYPSDEFLSASLGIPNRDVFYIILQGPAMCTNGAAADATEIIADGDALICKAGTSATNADAGRVVTISQSATDLSAASHINLVGFSMGVRLTTEVTSDILVNVVYHG